jgi:predicted RNA methylase
MKLKHLQSALSSVPTPQFPDPNITLEQYATSPILCSYIINAALQNGDIGYGRSVLDLGCGTGMLSIGSAIVGTSSVTLVDCDETAIEVARNNLIAMEIINDPDDSEDGYGDDDDDDACVVDFLMAKLKHTPKGNNSGRNNPRGGRGRGKGRGRGGRNKGRGGGGRSSASEPEQPIDPPSRVSPTDDGVPLASNCVDTVMTNPPFGTKPGNAGIDVTFLRTAIRLARRSVYSFHKSSTREYLLKTVASWGYQVEVVAQMKFDIPKMYKFHSRDIVDVDVDLIRVIVVVDRDGDGDDDVDVEEEQEDR